MLGHGNDSKLGETVWLLVRTFLGKQLNVACTGSEVKVLGNCEIRTARQGDDSSTGSGRKVQSIDEAYWSHEIDEEFH